VWISPPSPLAIGGIFNFLPHEILLKTGSSRVYIGTIFHRGEFKIFNNSYLSSPYLIPNTKYLIPSQSPIQPDPYFILYNILIVIYRYQYIDIEKQTKKPTIKWVFICHSRLPRRGPFGTSGNPVVILIFLDPRLWNAQCPFAGMTLPSPFLSKPCFILYNILIVIYRYQYIDIEKQTKNPPFADFYCLAEFISAPPRYVKVLKGRSRNKFGMTLFIIFNDNCLTSPYLILNTRYLIPAQPPIRPDRFFILYNILIVINRW